MLSRVEDLSCKMCRDMFRSLLHEIVSRRFTAILLLLTLNWLFGCSGAVSVSGNGSGTSGGGVTSGCDWKVRGNGFTQQVCQITVNGVQRTIGLHVPTNFDSQSNKMMLIYFHPSNGSHTNCMAPWYPVTDADGAALVCPDGTINISGVRTWNVRYCYSGGTPCSSNPSWNTNADDPALVKAIAAAAEQNLGVNPDYIFTTGFSAGAQVQGRLAQDAGDVISVAAPVSGTNIIWDSNTPGSAYAGNNPDPPAIGPVSWLAFRGVSESIPVCGGSNRQYETLDEELSYWARHNGCTQELPNANLFCTNGRGSSVTSERWKLWTNCKNGVEVRAYLLTNGSHTEYGSSYDLSSPSGCSAAPNCPFNKQLGIDYTPPIDEEYARWLFMKAHAQPHQLVVSKSGTGTITGDAIDCGTTCSESTTNGFKVTLSAVPASGSTFTGWTGCDSTSGRSCTITMRANRTVTATF